MQTQAAEHTGPLFQLCWGRVSLSALVLTFNFYPTLLSVVGKRERFNYSVFKSPSLNPKCCKRMHH